MKIFNLLKSDIRRTLKDKSTLFILISLFVFIIFFVLINFLSSNYNKLSHSEINNLTISITLNSIYFISLFAMFSMLLFDSKDFSYKTIQNKITFGMSRTKIYFSVLIYNLIHFIIIMIIGFFVAFISVRIFFGKSANFIDTFRIFVITLIPYICVVAFATFINISIKKPLISIVLNFAIIIFLGSILYLILNLFQINNNVLSYFEVIPHIAINILLSYDPFGLQTINNFYDGIYLAKLITSSLLFSTAITSLGVLIFNKSDIR